MKNYLIYTLIVVFACACKQRQSPTENIDTLIVKRGVDTLLVDNWKNVFDSIGGTGCFVLYSPTDSTLKVYNAQRADKRFTPASTFKIFNSLVILETGVLANENVIVKWDGVKRNYDKWNQDLNIRQAMKYSAVWFYQEMARRVGKEQMQHWLDTVGYGNTLIQPNVDDFWLEEGLTISPYEQIALLERLYNNTLPFSTRTMAIVKDIMKVDNVPYTMRAKTGWSMRIENKSVGWYVGWVEKDGKPYFFANNIDMPNDSDAAKRIEITIAILHSEGII